MRNLSGGAGLLMVDLQQLQECLVDLALQRSLGGFEEALKRTMTVFNLAAWACLLPASMEAGGRPLFIAHGINTGGEMLKRASQDGIGSIGLDTQGGAMLDSFARELAPRGDASWRVLRITRERRSELTMFLYRQRAAANFSREELQLLGKVGDHLNRCFLLLAKQQEQEFMAGLLRLVSNLYSEGMCVLDNQYRVVFENRNFREHMLLWEKGHAALQSLSLPRQTALPPDWTKACEAAFAAYRQLTLAPSPSRLVVTQGPLVNLSVNLARKETIEGAVRYLAFQGSLGVRPYLLLISKRQAVREAETPSLHRIAQAFKLSRRERQLAELVLEGRSAQEIGEKLAISMPTVKTHIRSILRKSGTKTRLQFAGLCRHE